MRQEGEGNGRFTSNRPHSDMLRRGNRLICNGFYL